MNIIYVLVAFSCMLQSDLPPPDDLGATVRIEGGAFMMGAPDGVTNSRSLYEKARPRHRQVVKTFEMGKYLVTAYEYSAFLNDTRSEGEPVFKDDGRDYLSMLSPQTRPNDPTYDFSTYLCPFIWIDMNSPIVFDTKNGYRPRPGYEYAPVQFVPYRGARRYCEWLSAKKGGRYRLPTEIEWEYAVRGSQGRTYPWGDESPAGRIHFLDSEPDAWYKPSMRRVGMFEQGKSPEGIYDLLGLGQCCGNFFYEYSNEGLSLEAGEYEAFASPEFNRAYITEFIVSHESEPRYTVKRGGQIFVKGDLVAETWFRFVGGLPEIISQHGCAFRVVRVLE